jgi:3D-(3,5/4)-trihydroxycyclohexane-1,2-dione acylhydrolase (decyclizing)
VTLALPQDVQTMAWDYPAELFAPRVVRFRAPPPAAEELGPVIEALRASRRPLIVAGGGALYAGASEALARFADAHGVPVCETQAGKSVLAWHHPLQLGAIGVTGSPAANDLAREADLVLAVGSRLSDFTTGSHALFPGAVLVGLNVNAFDATKWRGLPLTADARVGLDALAAPLAGWRADAGWTRKAHQAAAGWLAAVSAITARREVALPYDADVIGAVQRSSPSSAAHDIVVNAGGTLPAELHKLWRTTAPGGYHMEYGFSCMGYEIAGGLGVKLAHADREVIVMVGDGSYLMMNSEIATSVLLGKKLIIVVQDNHGYGCINRLQQACGGEPFNNLFADCLAGPAGPPAIDFAMHARALGAIGENVRSIGELELALVRARAADRTTVLCIETDPTRTTDDGGAWWEVAVPEASASDKVRRARDAYDTAKKAQVA